MGKLIDDPEHPEMQRALAELQVRLQHYVGRDVGPELYDRFKNVIKSHRNTWRSRGVDFPPLTVVVLPRLGTMDFYRADSDASSIKVQIVNTVKAYPQAALLEIVAAFKAAYPWLHPDDIAGNIIKVRGPTQ